MYRDLVFECAERVFAEEGVAESSMQDLAAEAGISLKTLYATFPGKQDIYREILAERGAGLVAAVDRASRAEGTALERLRIGLRDIVRYLMEHERFFRILLQEGHAWGLDPRSGSGRESWESGLSILTDVLKQGIASGEFLPADPDLLAPTINAILQVQLSRLLAREEEPDADAIADEILVTLDRMLRGVVPDPATRAA
jgi:AcrR family transcriptional regulator